MNSGRDPRFPPGYWIAPAMIVAVVVWGLLFWFFPYFTSHLITFGIGFLIAALMLRP